MSTADAVASRDSLNLDEYMLLMKSCGLLEKMIPINTMKKIFAYVQQCDDDGIDGEPGADIVRLGEGWDSCPWRLLRFV